MKNIIKKPIFIYLVALVIVVVASVVIFMTVGKKDIKPLPVAVKVGNITDVVSLTGQVQAAEGVDLSFERGGKIVLHNVTTGEKVYQGEPLVGLENSDLVAQVHQAEANVKIAQAKLDQMNIGAREEDLSIASSSVTGAEISLSQAQNALIEKLRDSYSKSDDAIRNQVDQIFSNPKSSNPKLIFQPSSPQLESDLESARVTIETTLNAWYSSLSLINNGSDFTSYNSDATGHLTDISNFLGKVASAVNGLTPTAQITQANISAWKASVSLARNNIDMAISNLNLAYQNLNTSQVALSVAQDKYLLTKEGATKEEIAAAEGMLESAKAALESANASLNKTIIYSPFEGVVAKDDVTMGATVNAGTLLITVISDAKSELTVDISEADISRVKVGDSAKVTLDAYGNSQIFDANVVSVDSSERIVDGVSVYQAKLDFVTDDSRIKDGMAANVNLVSDIHNNVLEIPFTAVLQKNGSYSVLVDNGNGVTESRTVQIGLKGDDGMIEIISGLKEGEKVLVY